MSRRTLINLVFFLGVFFLMLFWAVNNIVTPTRGHIHEAPAGTNGPIRVTFFETGQPVNLEDCTAVDRARIKDIIQNPHNYYVNIHNSAFPAGAIRGQMSK